MKMKQLFFGAATVFMLAAAGLMVQSAFTSHANATTGLSNGKTTLLDRVRELELQQLEDNREFLLFDATLISMDAKFEAKLMDLRAQLNELGVPVKPLIGDDIGLPLKANAAGVRRVGSGIVESPGGTGWLRDPKGTTNPAGKRGHLKGATVGPSGTGWFWGDPHENVALGPTGTGWLRDGSNGKTNPAGKRKKGVTVDPGGTAW